MMRSLKLILVCLMFVAYNNINAQTTISETEEYIDVMKQLENFPKSIDGYERYVIVLDKQEHETMFKIELAPGKTMEVDCNRHVLAGKIIEETVTGFGYTYYRFESNGNVSSTMMACPENTKHKRFIKGQSTLINYNSKLPIVVFVPKGCELKYVIWKVDETKDAEKK